MATKGVSGLGVGLMAAGGLLAWSGINNAGIIESLRALAKGQAPPKHPKEPFQPVVLQTATGIAAGTAAGLGGSTGNAVADQAQKHAGKHPYVFGAGHGSWNCGNGAALDCSGFASCVLHELGLLSSPKNTTGFLAWNGARTVKWEDRTTGDLIIWPQHMGIAISQSHMIHTGGASGCPCVVPYSKKRNGRTAVARRIISGVSRGR